jgi:hypothetical protein
MLVLKWLSLERLEGRRKCLDSVVRWNQGNWMS